MTKTKREALGVKPNDTIVISGTVVYARLLSKIEGAELEADTRNRKSRGQIPKERPYYTVTIEDVEVSNGAGTPLANFHGQEVYTRKTNGKKAITLESQSAFPVKMFQQDATNPSQAHPLAPTQEFAPGQKISILVKAYNSKQYNVISSSPQAILVPAGNISYYSANGSAADLAGFGLQLTPASEVSSESMPPLPTQSVSEAPAPAPETVAENPFGQADQPANPFGGETPASENPFAG